MPKKKSSRRSVIDHSTTTKWRCGFCRSTFAGPMHLDHHYVRKPACAAYMSGKSGLDLLRDDSTNHNSRPNRDTEDGISSQFSCCGSENASIHQEKHPMAPHQIVGVNVLEKYVSESTFSNKNTTNNIKDCSLLLEPTNLYAATTYGPSGVPDADGHLFLASPDKKINSRTDRCIDYYEDGNKENQCSRSLIINDFCQQVGDDQLYADTTSDQYSSDNECKQNSHGLRITDQFMEDEDHFCGTNLDFPEYDPTELPSISHIQIEFNNNMDNMSEIANSTTGRVPQLYRSIVPQYMSTTDERNYLKLIHLCDRLQGQRGAFGWILQWCREANKDGFNFGNNNHPSRNGFLSLLRKTIDYPEPIIQKVQLEGGASCIVNSFDARQQIINLLRNRNLFGDLSNLSVNPMDRWGRPLAATNGVHVDEVTSAKWFQDTYNSKNIVPGQEILFPIILYMDKTQIDHNSHYDVEPVMLTSGLFTRKTRSNPEAWVHLGFVSDVSTSAMAGRSNDVNKLGMFTRNYHHVLSVILQSLVELQQSGPELHKVQLGDETRYVYVHFEVCFILGDGKSADTLAGRYLNYAKGIGRISRVCLCNYDEADNESYVCQSIDLEAIRHHTCRVLSRHTSRGQQSESVNFLHSIAQHVVNNALNQLSYGCSGHDWRKSLPVDLLHCYLEGIILYSLTGIFTGLSSNHQNQFNRIATQLFTEYTARQQDGSNDEYPRVAICKGLCSTKMVTAKEWLGKTFCLLLVLLTDDGESIFQEHIDSNRQGAIRLDNGCGVNEVRELLEYFLMFYSYCKIGPFWSIDELHDSNTSSFGLLRFQEIVKRLILMIRTTIRRNCGNEWKLQKTHDMLHYSEQITLFGSLANTDTGICEKNLKQHAKEPGRSAQKQGQERFIGQVANRVIEKQILLRADQIIFGNTVSKEKTQDENCTRVDNQSLLTALSATPIHRNPFGYIIVNRNFNTPYSIRYRPTSSATHPQRIHQHVLDTIIDFLKHMDEAVVELYSEVDVNGFRFRAHHNYQGRGAWYDWANIDWDTGEPSVNNSLYPAKILCFFSKGVQEQVFACVHSCKDPSRQLNTYLTSNWELEYERTSKLPKLRCVNANAIRNRILCIQHSDGGALGCDKLEIRHARVTSIIDRGTWAQRLAGGFLPTL